MGSGEGAFIMEPMSALSMHICHVLGTVFPGGRALGGGVIVLEAVGLKSWGQCDPFQAGDKPCSNRNTLGTFYVMHDAHHHKQPERQ